MLTWLDGRNGSSFNGLSWTGNTLTFSIAVGSGANNLQAMDVKKITKAISASPGA